MYGYGTIEPRLIALLNDTSPEYTHHSSLALPPLQDPNILKSSGRPSPLEPDAGIHRAKHANPLAGQNASYDRDLPAVLESIETPKKTTVTERALGGSSPQSLRKILDDPDTGHISSSKKRDRLEDPKEDFVQLPQPPKKQKAVTQPVPPIINGLHEPPPQTALYPPIASSSFHDSHGRNSLNVAPAQSRKEEPPARVPSKQLETAVELAELAEPAKPDKKKARTRRRWTEEETTHLLKGVQEHGIGKWAQILEDGRYKFNGRTHVDLKDRFRIVCPTELRGKVPKGSKETAKDDDEPVSKTKPRTKPKLNPIFDNILLSSSDESPAPADQNTETRSASNKKRQSRNHRKNLSDLEQLGIHGPFRPSARRTRRAFTAAEDDNILLALAAHGTRWAAMTKDARFDLARRRPTDIRDRIRNKWPQTYSALFAESAARKERDTMESGGGDEARGRHVDLDGRKGEREDVGFVAFQLLTPDNPTSSQESTTRPPHRRSSPPAQNTLPPFSFDFPSVSSAAQPTLGHSSIQSGHSLHANPLSTTSHPYAQVSAPAPPAQFLSFSELLTTDADPLSFDDWAGNGADGAADGDNTDVDVDADGELDADDDVGAGMGGISEGLMDISRLLGDGTF